MSKSPKLVDGKSYPDYNTYNYQFSYFHPEGHFKQFVIDKDKSQRIFASKFILQMLKMFKYTGLPDTIPQHFLEYYLLLGGSCCITEVHGKLYALQGSFGGEPDPYYRATKYIVANPALKFSSELELNYEEPEKADCIIIKNDPMYCGLKPIIEQNSYLLAENLVTLRTVDINLRLQALISAPEDNSLVAAKKFMQDLEDGTLSAVGENRFLEGIKLQTPTHSNTAFLTQFIELHQYYKGSLYNDIGLEANYNMKRAQINEEETTLDKDALLPLVEVMLETRKHDIDLVNSKYGTDITVEFDSSWAMNQKEVELMLNSSELDPSDTFGAPLMEGEQNERNDQPARDESEETSVGLGDVSESTSSTGNETSETDNESRALSDDSTEDISGACEHSGLQGYDLPDVTNEVTVVVDSDNVTVNDSSELEIENREEEDMDETKEV